MNAELAWRVWRRVLQEPRLAEAVVDGSVLNRSTELGLAEADQEVLRHYALNPSGVTWAVEGYRFRLVRVTRYCVAQAAPLTARALAEAGYDLRELAQQYVEYSGWQDRGPHQIGLALDYLAFVHDVALAGRNGTESRICEVVNLETAGLRLVKRDALAPARDTGSGRWTDRAALVSVRYDVTPWLSEPNVHPLVNAVEAEGAFLVYLVDSAESYRMVALSEAATTVSRLLAAGVGSDGVAVELGLPPGHPALRAMLETFVDWGVITPIGEVVGVGAASEVRRSER